MLNVNDPTSFLPDFFGGRIPADDAVAALAVVDQKMLAYERTAPVRRVPQLRAAPGGRRLRRAQACDRASAGGT